jgi:polysaccharide biosynthesis/export protein
VTESYVENLSVEPTSKTTTIAAISLQNTVKQRGIDFINCLVDFYNLDANDEKNEVAQKSAEFIDERIGIINRELGTAETELADFKQRSGLTDLTSDARLALEESSKYEQQLTDINTTTQPTLQQYLVNNKGEIDFPVIGRLKVGGLTKNEAEDLIREQLQPYLKESPIVTVRMANYKISVLGEVNRPGTFTVGNEKVNILEALAMAGDMTVYGVRDNVKLIREDAKGKREIINLNLNNAELVVSPYYYLRQNDIIYVTPNKTKAKNSDIGSSTSIWISATSILVSLASLLATILK